MRSVFLGQILAEVVRFIWAQFPFYNLFLHRNNIATTLQLFPWEMSRIALFLPSSCPIFTELNLPFFLFFFHWIPNAKRKFHSELCFFQNHHFLEHSSGGASLNSRILTSSEVSIVIYLIMNTLTFYHLFSIHVTSLIYHFDSTPLPVVILEPCRWWYLVLKTDSLTKRVDWAL